MRLLRSQCDDDGRFSLVEFERDEIPRYAILSHTWLETSQEVTFEDIHRRSGLEKEGYGKLRFCADRAKDAGLKYFWVDTCCIKKTDSAELSEAINSMFYWYSRSEICYAFLADVTTDIDRPWLSQLLQSRWHKRGWTLQELLAPRMVEFWSQDWVRLGDRRSLAQAIHHATKIPVVALLGRSLQSFTVQERYDWMSGRQTKLQEDQAYCLLGIFDVSIPVIYGEGKRKSISRLNDEIARTFRNDLQIGQTTAPTQFDSDTQTSQRSPSHILRRPLLFRSLKQDTLDDRRFGLTSAQAGTCQWLMDHTMYKSWQNPDNFQQHRGFLWIKGKPGAGKSTMMKYIYERTELSRQHGDIVISFFFNARGAEYERSTSGMWRALLYQLLAAAPDLQPVLDTALFPSEYDTAAPPWTVKNLSVLFSSAVSELGKRHLTCFIDALDECDEEEIRLMVDTLEDIGEAALGSEKQPHVCFASRHYPHISLRFGHEVVLEREAGHSEDLSSYIRKQLRAHSSKKADELRLQIQEKANGVFMWAVIVIPMLRRELDKGRIHAVKKKLLELPRELSDLFRDMLGRDKENLAETVLGYQWILFAERPLTKREYYYAVLSGDCNSSDALVQWDPQEVTEEDMKQFVSSSSKGLAEVTGSNHTVQFIHESVRDFLLKEEGFRELAQDLAGNITSIGHARLSECCQTYLKVERSMARPEAEQLDRSHQQDFLRKTLPFIEYASEHVLDHANRAAADLDPADFLSTFPLRVWVAFRNLFDEAWDHRHTNHTSLLYVLAGSGCQNLVQYLCRDGPVIGEHGEHYHYPLFAALARDHFRTAAAMLLPRTLDFQTILKFETWDIGFPDVHPVVWALTQGRDTIVERLLQARDFHWEDVEIYQGRSLLCFAIEGNSVGMVARFARMDRFTGLIDAQHHFKVPGSVEAREKLEGFTTTPLGYAAASGYLELAGILIDLGAEICPGVHLQYSPLNCAIRYGTVDVVSLLFERSTTDVNKAIAFGTIPMHSWTPLCAAAIYDRPDLARWLLEHGAQVDLRGENGQTPLQLASERGHRPILHVLLAFKAEIAASDNESKTALHLAAARGQVGFLEALLAHSRPAPTASQSTTNPHPDSSALRNDQHDVLDICHHSRTGDRLGALAPTGPTAANIPGTNIPPARDVSIEARDHHGATPLINAAQNGRLECLRILLRQGACVDACTHRGETALMYAVSPADHDWTFLNARQCVYSLLEHDASMEIKDHQGMTAFLHAAKHHFRPFVALLLQAGADQLAKNHQGESARDLFPDFEWDEIPDRPVA